jgi:hypothetical protein
MRAIKKGVDPLYLRNGSAAIQLRLAINSFLKMCDAQSEGKPLKSNYIYAPIAAARLTA